MPALAFEQAGSDTTRAIEAHVRRVDQCVRLEIENVHAFDKLIHDLLEKHHRFIAILPKILPMASPFACPLHRCCPV
ncbi:MAG: hypothetical protein ACI8T1_003512 [Verrucomicrobiales bacterium]|jgi:hypothetical protein